MAKAIIEILQEINKDPDILEQYKHSMLLKTTIEYAFNPELKFALPEGIPPYKPDTCPLGTSPTNFNNEIRRLYIFTPQKELDKVRRETLFIQLLETIHQSEAELLLAIKDQTLHILFPNVTPELMNRFEVLSDETLAKWRAVHPSVGKHHVLEVTSDATITTTEVIKPKRGRKSKSI